MTSTSLIGAATSGLLALASFALASAAPAHAGDPSGVWLTQNADARIRIASCGPAICGSIIGLKDPIDSQTGKPETDKNNPDPSKRGRPLIGVQLLLGMMPAGRDRWSGRIYNADDGKTYDGSVTLQGPTSLKIEGCVAMFCGSEIWTRTK